MYIIKMISLSFTDSIIYFNLIYISCYIIIRFPVLSAGFPYRLNRLKPRASKFKGPLAKVYNVLNTVI